MSLQNSLNSEECDFCAQSGWGAGHEFFDSTLLPHLPKLSRFLASKVHKHHHKDTGQTMYVVEAVVKVGKPVAATLRFDGPADPEAETAISLTLELADELLVPSE